jgi:hypothetical protein
MPHSVKTVTLTASVKEERILFQLPAMQKKLCIMPNSEESRLPAIRYSVESIFFLF